MIYKNLDKEGHEILKDCLKIWLHMNEMIFIRENRISYAKVRWIDKQIESIIKRIKGTEYDVDSRYETTIISEQLTYQMDKDYDYIPLRFTHLQMWIHAIIRKIGNIVEDVYLDTAHNAKYYDEVLTKLNREH